MLRQNAQRLDELRAQLGAALRNRLTLDQLRVRNALARLRSDSPAVRVRMAADRVASARLRLAAAARAPAHRARHAARRAQRPPAHRQPAAHPGARLRHRAGCARAASCAARRRSQPGDADHRARGRRRHQGEGAVGAPSGATGNVAVAPEGAPTAAKNAASTGRNRSMSTRKESCPWMDGSSTSCTSRPTRIQSRRQLPLLGNGKQHVRLHADHQHALGAHLRKAGRHGAAVLGHVEEIARAGQVQVAVGVELAGEFLAWASR